MLLCQFGTRMFNPIARFEEPMAVLLSPEIGRSMCYEFISYGGARLIE